MASSLKNLSQYHPESIPEMKGYTFGIVTAEWNTDITQALLNGAYDTLLKHGVDPANIYQRVVPGTFELTLGAQRLAADEEVDAVIALGCVIQGETKHFDFICQAVAYGITECNLRWNKPVIFGVLTTDNLEQALDRSGGKHGNKGVEAAVTAIKMLLDA